MSDKPNRQRFATRAIHAGQQPDPTTGAIMTPIYATSTFVQESPGKHLGYEYARTQNPTRGAYEACVADLENGSHGYAFASGMAAIGTILELLDSGDHVISMDDLYGGTFRIFENVRRRSANLDFSFVDMTDTDRIAEVIKPNTKMIWVETPTNPLLNVVDIAAVAEVAHGGGAKLVVDNTFATPYLQQPLGQGADVVVHSTTKYCGGHSDVVGGFIATNDTELAERLAYLQNAIGAVGSPFDNYLTLRGLKTLAVRMDRHCENARAIVELLLDSDKVTHVLYPGLPEHRGHEVASRQMSDFGGMVSFRVAGGAEAAMRLTTTTQVFSLAESLGAVESLIEHPGVMTHASAAGSELEVPADLVRLSVGIESAQDLIDDLGSALERL